MDDDGGGKVRPDAFRELLGPDIVTVRAVQERTSRGFSPLNAMAASVLGSVIGETRTSLPFGRSSAATET
jgi:hypothetical protein